MKLILVTILLLLLSKTNAGPITAYTLCSTCCATVHATDWIGLIAGAAASAYCIAEACITPFPGMCLDPRNNACVAVFLGAAALPTP